LSCGSPIGRVIDEAGDGVQYTCFAGIMGWIIGIPPGILCLSYGLINLPMYTMEINFILTGTLTITATDELGPVEMELIFSSIFLLAAILGVNGMQKKVIESLGWSFISENLLWREILAFIFVVLLCMFTLDNINNAMKTNAKKTLYYLLAPIFVLINASIAA
jgi:hypothetical protein